MTDRSDNPIRNASEDRLGRVGPASAFAEQVLSLDASEGAVVAVLGPWGSGKTSFVALARPRLEEGAIAVTQFNPWLFSGTDSLVEAFFSELSVALGGRQKLGEIAEGFGRLGETFSSFGWLPLIGGTLAKISVLARAASKASELRKRGVQVQRDELAGMLAKLEHPVVVVLDDIDRLETAEIREVFRLVRLTASFPNLIYVLAFDRARVEAALAEENVPGRDYLEKILQLAIDLPEVPDELLSQQIFEALNKVLDDDAVEGEFDQEVWPDLFVEIIHPLISNMRDVKRYVVAAEGTLKQLKGDIAVADVLALEAIRVFRPDLFAAMRGAREALTTPGGIGFGGYEPPELKEAIERLRDDFDEPELVKAMISRLFPFALRHIENNTYGHDWQKSFLRKRRVAHRALLDMYYERVAGADLLNFSDAERAHATMHDLEAFEGYFAALEPSRRESVIASLESFEGEFRPEQVVPGTVVLCNVLDELPERPRGMTDFGTNMVVTRVVVRLMRACETPADASAAVAEALPQIRSLSSRHELLSSVGYRENAGLKLIFESDYKRFEAEWREKVRAASADELARERDLALVLYFAGADDEEVARPDVPDDPAVTNALLESVKGEVRGNTLGSRSIRRSLRLSWDMLCEVCGGEDAWIARYDQLKASDLDVAPELIEIADRYASGWRPRDFADGDDEDDDE